MTHRAIGDLVLQRARRLETERRREDRRRIEEAIFLELQRQQEAKEEERERAQLEERAASQAKIKEEKEKERLKMEQEAANMMAAFSRVLVGQMSFPSESEWARLVEGYCKTIEAILPKIGKEKLSDGDLFFWVHYHTMLLISKTSDLTSLRIFLRISYHQQRQNYFHFLLQGTGSCLDAWVPLF